MSFGGFGSGGSAFGNNNNTTSGFGGFGSNTSNTNAGFGANNNSSGFGTPSNTGGGLFGSGSGTSGFGSNASGGFGSTSNTGAFGSKPAFGSTPTTGSAGGGGLFGGSTTTTSGGFGGFGSNASNTTTTTSSPFGGGGTSIFGSSNKPAFGSTNTGTTGGGLFGSTNTSNTTATSGFGGFGGASNAPASTSLGPVGDPPGTAGVTNFQPFVEKENAASSAQNSFQNILFQDPYKKWSAEELRLADYAAGRRYGGTAGTGTFGVGSGFGGFGSSNQQSNAFGSTTNTNTGGGLFGSNTPTTSGFGQNTSTTSGFGSGGGGLFGNKPASGGGMFGSTSTSQPAQSGGLFGSGGFGNTGNTGNAFGSTNTNTGGGLFGSSNTNQNKGFSFGNANAPSNTGTGGGLFGSSNTGSGFGSNTASNTGGGGLFGSNTNTTNQNTGGGMFGSANQQNTGGSAFGGGGGFGSQNQQQSGGGLFGSSQQKPAGGGLFGSTNTTSGTGGGLFGGQSSSTSPFGQSTTNQTGGGLFGSKPATTGGVFGQPSNTQNTNTGGGLFGGLGQNNQNQPQQQQGGGLFSSLGQNQQKPSMFGGATQSTGGGLFGTQNNQQQGSVFGSSNAQQQPQNNMMGSSILGSSQNQGTPSLLASVNDPKAYGSLFANLGNEAAIPGPLATPTNKRQSKRPSILPYYKLNPASASRFVTPQKRGYGFSYSTYGTPNSPSSVASTPGSMSQSLLGGSLSRSLGKSVSTSNLRRSFNVEDSLLAPGAFSASSGPRFHGSNNVKKLVINKDLRSDLFSTPTKDKNSLDTPNGSRKLTKRVSFDTSNPETIENGEFSNSSTSSPSAEQLGYVRPKGANGINGTKPDSSSSAPEMEQVKGNELAVVHEEETAPPPVQSTESAPRDGEPGEYWMSPSKEEIQDMNRVQRQKVSNFTVGRENVGYVRFKVPVDLTTVDIDNIFDNIVVLVPRSATVYPNAAKKPAVGKGLNVPSLINLENAWPRATKKGKPTSLAKHVERLRRIPDTTFENYNAETGEWTFSVEHFTTYGLDESDEDEDVEPQQLIGPSTSGFSNEDQFAPLSPSPSPSPPAPRREFHENGASRSRQNHAVLPGAFDPDDSYVSDEEEMAEVTRSQPSFLANRSAGSLSNALGPIDQDDVDDEYDMSEAHEDASASLGHHLAAEQEDNSFDIAQFDAVPETPAGIMRARMRAIKTSATPMKVQVASGDDWMDMLSKTISPQKRDRALLKSINEAENHRALNESVQEKSPTKKRIISDSRGFATSIDLMNSLFEKAKSPAENLQASIRPQGVKWPYKRVTKHLDESEMDDIDRTWHDTMRPTWGPSGTLVFSATPDNSAFRRSGRISEKNGLMTVMKGGIVSESQDIRIAKFTNEMSAKAIDAHTKLTQIQIIGNIPTIKINPRTSLKDFSVGSGAKNSAEEHERLVWELASVLFDNVRIPAELQSDPEALEKLRLENLSRFWERLVEEQTNKIAAMAKSSEEKALAHLSGHRVAEACKHLLDGKNFRLATLISLIGTSEGVKKDIREQMKEWQEANVLSEFSQPIRALYEMLSGNVCVCEGTKGALENRTESFLISQRFGLNWQQAFGLRLWYSISNESSVADAVEKYKEDVKQDRELPPTTWFIEHGIKGIWNDPDQDKREDLLWGLLKLYSNDAVDLEAVLRPENSQLSPLDYRLCWQLGQALTSTGRVSFGKNAIEKADAATISFSAQLTNEGSWLEASFVLLHLTDPDARSRAIQDHLCRHAGLIGNEDSSSFRKLAVDLKMPTRWIWHAKALFMRSVKKDPTAEVQCLLRAESWADAHRTFIKEVAPIAIIEHDYNGLANLLQQFEGHHSQVPDWNVGYEIYRAFLQLVGYQRRAEMPPPMLVNGLLEGLPAMHGNTPEAGIMEYAALTEMAAEVAKVVARMAKAGEIEYERILHLPLTEDVLLRHSRDLAWSHYTTVMAGH
ncbi:nuclear protein 96-domain-containing protein [Xylariaceae sp. FL0662B]|nr:nuclear protein 96-domain-containing protein [Xylariaceae sp. FL0662B]